MNLFRRFAEMAQNRLFNPGTSHPDPGNERDEPVGYNDVTPSIHSFAYNESMVFAPMRRPLGQPPRVFHNRSANNASHLIVDGIDAIPPQSPSMRRTAPGQQSQRGHLYRHSFQIQIARNLIDLARGYPNTRSIHRKNIQHRANTFRITSSAYPGNHANSFVDEFVRPHKFDAIVNGPLPSLKVMQAHAWNADDRSLNIYVKDDKLTFHRQPVPQSTDCIRGMVGFSRGFHVWQFVWPLDQRGTHPIVGVATKNAPLHANGYGSLLGTNAEGYGWDIRNNKCYHDSKKAKGWSYPSLELLANDNNFIVPDKFYCILNMDEGYMAFSTSSQFLGIAFRGLKGKTLYPMVSAVWGQCEVTMRYMGSMEPQPRPLIEVCRRKVCEQMGKSRLDRVEELNLPLCLNRYVSGKTVMR